MFKPSSATIPAAGAVLFGIVVCLAPAMTPGPLAQAQQPAAAQGAGRSGRGDGAVPPAPVDPKQLLQGTDEDDTIKGGSGDDWLFGKKGNDWLAGGGGRDAIDGFEGEDTIDGGDDADIIDGGAGSDTIRGGEGDDTIDGGDDDDTIDGGDGADDLDGGDGSDMLRGGAGNDRLAGGDENDVLNGGAGADRLAGEDGVDLLLGGPGDDLLFGGEDDDTADGELGDDRVDGGDGNDFLRGGPGDDVLLGSSGQDTLQGGAGHDVLLGGDDDDVLNGGVGSDWAMPGSGADVVALGDGDDLVVIRAADVPAGELETINGGRGADMLILNGFGRPPGTGGAGRRGGDGNGEIADPITGGTYNFRSVEGTEFTQLITTTTGGAADRPASLLLVNPASTPAAGRMLVYGADGAVVPVAAGAAAAREVVPFTVPALGSLRIDNVASAPATVQIFSSVPLGSVLDNGSLRVAEAAMVDSALVPIVEDARSGVTTGLVLTGSIAATNVNLSLHRQDGEEIDGETFSAAREIALAPYAQTTLFVRDLFPALGDFRGSLSVDADTSRAQEGGPVTVTVIERGAAGRLAAAPALPLLVSAPAGGRVHLPNVTAGGGATTSIVLTNALRARTTQGTLRFFDESGNPWLVGINGQAPTATVPFDLGPQGSLVVTLPDAGPLRRGSAQAEATQGRVGATVRETSADGAARVPPGNVAAGVIAAVRRDRARGTTTRIAIASTGSAVEVTLTLRTASGMEVPGATAALRIAANGQIVRALEEIFPGPAADAFEGTLTIAATGGTIAAAVVEVQTATGVVAALPVAETD